MAVTFATASDLQAIHERLAALEGQASPEVAAEIAALQEALAALAEKVEALQANPPSGGGDTDPDPEPSDPPPDTSKEPGTLAPDGRYWTGEDVAGNVHTTLYPQPSTRDRFGLWPVDELPRVKANPQKSAIARRIIVDDMDGNEIGGFHALVGTGAVILMPPDPLFAGIPLVFDNNDGAWPGYGARYTPVHGGDRYVFEGMDPARPTVLREARLATMIGQHGIGLRNIAIHQTDFHREAIDIQSLKHFFFESGWIKGGANGIKASGSPIEIDLDGVEIYRSGTNGDTKHAIYASGWVTAFRARRCKTHDLWRESHGFKLYAGEVDIQGCEFAYVADPENYSPKWTGRSALLNIGCLGNSVVANNVFRRNDPIEAKQAAIWYDNRVTPKGGNSYFPDIGPDVFALWAAKERVFRHLIAFNTFINESANREDCWGAVMDGTWQPYCAIHDGFQRPAVEPDGWTPADELAEWFTYQNEFTGSQPWTRHWQDIPIRPGYDDPNRNVAMNRRAPVVELDGLPDWALEALG